MAIIAILNPKGGSGKTTLSTNLAQSLYERGKSVLIVDSDPQGSARDWHATMEGNPLSLISLDRPSNLKTLNTISISYDFVVIDGAAKLENMIAATIKVADVIILPIQPSPYDLWAASDLVEFISARQEVTDGKPLAALVVNRAVQGTKLEKEIGKALKEVELELLKTQIIQRQIYPQTASEGKTVFSSSNSDAKEEINHLTDELLLFISKGVL